MSSRSSLYVSTTPAGVEIHIFQGWLTEPEGEGIYLHLFVPNEGEIMVKLPNDFPLKTIKNSLPSDLDAEWSQDRLNQLMLNRGYTPHLYFGDKPIPQGVKYALSDPPDMVKARLFGF